MLLNFLGEILEYIYGCCSIPNWTRGRCAIHVPRTTAPRTVFAHTYLTHIALSAQLTSVYILWEMI